MSHISEQTIHEAIDKLHSTPQDQLAGLFTGIGNSQPVLLALMMDYSDELKETESKNALIYMFAIVVLSFEIHGVTPAVTVDEVEAEQHKQMSELMQLEGKTDDELESLVSGINFSQPVLFDFVKDQLLSEAEDTGIHDEQRMASTFSVLKLAIDTMTASQNRMLAGRN